MAVSERSFNLANWEEHPSDNRYFIFRFNKAEYAHQFEALLSENGIEFESDVQDDLHLFAISRNHFDQARKLNYLVMAEHRQPMIANPFLRYGFVLIVLCVVTISLIGHCNKKVNDREGVNDPTLEKQDSLQ